MKPQERKLLVDELWLWEKRGKGKGREAEQAFVAQVAMLLFLRWSWASDTLRTVLATLSSMLFMPSTIDSGRHIEILGRTLACRGPTGQLPFDVRQGRVKALLADSDNKSFWDMMRNRPEVLWNSVREIAVVPHSDDWNVW
ncbi:hypothetical protein B0T21DRAFT_280606 [Apiosordaria backusii]|uniref:Uncharacterized protein n=1 Tax=Apiosordaria backusii TaxID=314023 RepID=A0AA40ET25_9PEZI|nr:hypothetical protein B0T21DRAFT_280606 [Apiosordaria backusii]